MEFSFDLEFGYLWLWSEKESDFVCIEPVVCHPSKWPEQAIKIPA
jgi:galactose mutarotase-like enzyme